MPILTKPKVTNMRNVHREHARVQSGPYPETMAKQSMKDECDINILMLKYQKTGMLDHIIRYKGQYADVFNQGDYQDAIHTIREAEEMFDSLPSSVRDRFGNSPARFLAFVEDPNNKDEMAAIGLLDKPPKSAEPEKAAAKPAEPETPTP